MEDIERLNQHVLEYMRSDTIENYICPGLRSSMIAQRPDGACVRLFEASRDTREFPVTPHNHGYAFTALVLEGCAVNIMYIPERQQFEWRPGSASALYVPGMLEGGLGEYSVNRYNNDAPMRYQPQRQCYRAGNTYSMREEEIHSIEFEAGTRVLMFCGPRIQGPTVFLEPYVEGFGRVPLFENKPWMFKRVTL